jgi:ParB family chromosome partitioning protein
LLPAGDALGEIDERDSLLEVPVDQIRPNPNQPRRQFDAESLAELAESIRQLGVLQPVLVRPRPGGYQLVAGERRLRAARTAGLRSVPAVIVEADDRGALERALVENLQRENLNPIEEATGYRSLIEEGGLTQEELGERLGRSRATVTNALRLLDLPTTVQRMLTERQISAGHGRALLGLAGNPFQERLARRAGQEGLSVRETEDLVRRYQAMTGGDPGAARASGSAARPGLVVDAQRVLSDSLQTRVRVEMGKRKGKIVLDFATLDELDRLVKAIVGRSATHPERVTPT